MSNILRIGAAFLHEKRHEHLSDEVTYKRAGQTEIYPSATPVDAVNEFLDEDGVVIQSRLRDFIIRPEDLVIDGTETRPIARDLITETDEATGIKMVFHVVSDNGSPVWEWSGEYRNAILVHTKLLRMETQ